MKEDKEKVLVIKPVVKNTRLPEEVTINTRHDLAVPRQNDRTILPLANSEDPHDIAILEEALSMSQGPGFRQGIQEFWLNRQVRVSVGGRKLNYATQNFKPVILDDYLDWLIVQAHMEVNSGVVATDESTARNSPNCLFYVYDEGKVKAEKSQIIDEENTAHIEMAELLGSHNWNKIDWIIAKVGLNPYQLSKLDKKIKLKEIIEGNPRTPEDAVIHYDDTITYNSNKVSYKKRPALYFVALCKDEMLESRVMIQILIKEKIIQIAGGKYYIGETELGTGIEAVLHYIHEEIPESKQMLNMLRGRYSEYLSDMKLKKNA